MEKNTIFKAFGISGICVFLQSCGAATPATATATPTVLQGTWLSSNCANNFKQTFVFANSAFTKTLIRYSDVACATPVITLTQTGTIAVGAAVTTPASSTAINFTTATLTGTPSTGNATALNSGPQCATTAGGSTSSVTFADNVASDITGKYCGGSGATTTAAEPIAAAIGYNIFSLITTTTPNTFTLGSVTATTTLSGDLLGAATAATIPTTLLSGLVYSKQ